MKTIIQDAATVAAATTPGYLLWLNHYGTPVVAFVTALCGLGYMIFRLLNEIKKYKDPLIGVKKKRVKK